jgi:hypothetical protein
MERMFGVAQLLFSGVFAASALGTLINMLFIASRPETISVVNSIIGQLVLIICLLALSRILFKKGMLRLRSQQ